MRMSSRCCCLFLLLIFLAGAVGMPVTGATPDPKTLQQMIQKTRQEISNQKKREKSVLNNLLTQQQKLNQLQNNYQQTKQNLGVAQKKVNLTQKELVGLENNLNTLNTNLKQQQLLLDKRLIVLYTKGPQSYLEMIFQAKDFADLISRFNTVAYFVKNDLRMIDEIEETQLQVHQQKIVVQNKKAQVDSEYHQILNLKTKLVDQQQKVTSQIGTAKDELQKIQTNREQLEKALDEMEQTSREIEAQIQRKEKTNPGVALGTGSLIWPVRGPITSPFGWRYHPILKEKKYHSGLDIAVAMGTPVHAADNGVVVVSGWQGGYGNFVAIDHGNGISTCYGHNSRLLVREGDKVTRGQVISFAGSTGLSTGPHVHFEVRKNGACVDPLGYLP